VHPTIESLRGFGTFTRVISHGKKFEQKPLKAFMLSSVAQKTELCIGFAVTRGIRKAVHRNLVKRLMREAFRSNREEYTALVDSGMRTEIVFLYNGGIILPSKKNRRESINQAFAGLSSTMKSVCPGVTI